MTPGQFAQQLNRASHALNPNFRAAARASAELLGSRIRRHIQLDDLPLQALSQEWLRQKAADGANPNHLWYTGAYQANFGLTDTPTGTVVGTNRPVAGQPSFNLPEWLERNYPVWRLTLDECEPLFEWNYLEAVRAAMEGRKPRFKNQ
jgi:hypothetical protein